MADISLWGVTDKGFYRPTIDDIVNERNKKAKEVFGDDFDTDGKTPQGKYFRINAAAESRLCEIAEQVYYSFSHLTATGLSLDRVCSDVNLTRDSAGYAAHLIRVYGTEGHVIPVATLFKNIAGIEFYSTTEATINQSETTQDGTVYYTDVTVCCTDSGTVGNVQNINATVEVDTDITSVEYQSVVTYGTEIESDPDLRGKYENIVQGLGTNTEAAIKANVLRVSGVNDVKIINNRTEQGMVISSDLTIASGSYAVIVHTDDKSKNTDIAEAIMEKQPLGIMQSGVESVTLKDDSGTDQKIKFTYVTEKKLPVVVACTVDSSFPSNGEDEIKSRITAYINGLGIGQEVVYSQLYNYIYDVTGVYKITSMSIDGGTSDIDINKIQIAKAGDISLTITEA